MATRPDLDLKFSISATSRSPRAGEVNGREYYFMSEEEFREKIRQDAFVEWEEVYEGTFYGTLLSEVVKKVEEGHTVIMDIDVKGSLNVKKRFGDSALAIFVMPPSVYELESRLRNRATDTEADVKRRLAKAEFEMSFAPRFDCTVVNDHLQTAADEVADKIKNFKP